jgi:citrate/tricarballylate utilization protein
VTQAQAAAPAQPDPHPSPDAAPSAEAQRALAICNICGYCNGLCAVFDAARRRPALTDPDLDHLANLCHGCRSCLYDCQYAPPHAFAVNIPQALARVRWRSYAAHAWPPALALLFQRNGWAASLVALAAILAVVGGVLAVTPAEVLFASHHEPGAFYRIVPHAVMVAGGVLSLGWSVLAIAVASWRFARRTRGPRAPSSPCRRIDWRGPIMAALELIRLSNLRGGGPGCHERAGRPSHWRRRLHYALLAGLLLCFAATLTALGYHQLLDRAAPYPLLSAPVLLGSIGGMLMLIGVLGLGWLRWRADPEPLAAETTGADRAALALLLLVTGSGLALLLWRATPAMGLLLGLHLGAVLALFLLLPYSRLIHGAYRGVALLHDAQERAREMPAPDWSATSRFPSRS